MIDHVLDRACAISGIDRVVLVTSVHQRDDALATHVEAHDAVEIVRGSEHDVLHRYLIAAELVEADVVMRLTGDCPFLCPRVAEEVLARYFDNPLEAEYVSNDTLCSGYPDGTDVEIFSIALLKMAHQRAVEQADREHVTRWMRRSVLTAMLKSETDWSSYKLSVDSMDDYLFAKRLATKLPKADYRLAVTLRAIDELDWR